MARGNGRAYSIQRLRSAGHDEVADRVERRELSAHRALIEVGLKKETAVGGTPEQLARAVQRLEADPKDDPGGSWRTPRERFFDALRETDVQLSAYVSDSELSEEVRARVVAGVVADLHRALDLTFDEHATAILSAPPAARRMLLRRWADELVRRTR